MRILWIFSIFIIALSAFGQTQFGGKREPAFSLIPQELNEKAAISCLSKLSGFISSQETTSLDNMKTKIERIYGLKRPMMQYRELLYKTQAGEKWKVEFYLMPDSLWGKEKYKLKFFRAGDKGFYVEASSPIKEELFDKDAVLKFAQYEEVEGDERWEQFAIPGDPLVSYKSKDFKLFQLTAAMKKSKATLLCNIAGGHPFCQCSK